MSCSSNHIFCFLNVYVCNFLDYSHLYSRVIEPCKSEAGQELEKTLPVNENSKMKLAKTKNLVLDNPSSKPKKTGPSYLIRSFNNFTASISLIYELIALIIFAKPVGYKDGFDSTKLHAMWKNYINSLTQSKYSLKFPTILYY